jgi:hypothetical protein
MQQLVAALRDGWLRDVVHPLEQLVCYLGHHLHSSHVLLDLQRSSAAVLLAATTSIR